MIENFSFSAPCFNRGIENVEAPIIPTSSNSTTLQRVAAVTDNTPHPTFKGTANAAFEGVEQRKIAGGTNQGHDLQKHIRIQSI